MAGELVTFLPNLAGMAELTGNFNRGVGAVAERAAEIARQNAPVLTGALRDSIHVEPDGLGGFDVVTDTGYGIFPEIGTAYMPAEPYLAPALVQAMDEMGPLIAAEMAL